MKKKILILISAIFLLCSCTNITQSDYDTLISETISSNAKIYNTYRKGYKFYLPKSLYLNDSKDYNEIISSPDATYYLYIDLVSYLNKKDNTYTENSESYYSKMFTNADKNGYIEINLVNDKYLVEIMYNYAKIEVMVDESYLKKSVANAMIVLASIYYNDDILNNYSSENILNYSEETIDIFKSDGTEGSNFVEYIEEYDNMDDSNVPDYDLIN